MKNAAIIMAAGLGTRMKSRRPKILHEVCGKPMLQWVIDALAPLKLDRIVVVLGSKGGEEFDLIKGNISYVIQKEKKGTAHAVRQAEKELTGFKGNVLILSGDVPLISTSTLKDLLRVHKENSSIATILTAYMNDPTGYGRILKSRGQIVGIVEELNADDHTRKIQEINTGTYCIRYSDLTTALKQVKLNPLKKEYYLTDIFSILNSRGARVTPMAVPDPSEMMGVNRRDHLETANRLMQKRIQRNLMDHGVTILDGQNTYIDATVRVGQDTEIYPFTLLYGHTVIGENGQIGPSTHIRDSRIGNETLIHHSYITDSIIEDQVTVGPYAHIRESTVLKKGVRIGNFVEITRSVLNDQTRAFHLSYIGDAEIGKKVNLGAGVITANWDMGKRKKFKTNVGDGAAVGSHTVLVAPAHVPARSVVPANSIIRGKTRSSR